MPELLPWHHLPSKDVLFALRSSPEGLQPEEVKKRLMEHGRNQIRIDKPTSALKIFFRQVSSPLMMVLAIALGLSMALGKITDSLLTLAVMGINVLMGFIQEYKADRALHALKNYLPTNTTVRRAGKVVTIPADEIVPGDILLLSAGAKVTADARILSAYNFAANEAALTGESNEVMKLPGPVDPGSSVADRASMVFAGSIAVLGKAEAVVVATGKHTEFGKVTEMVVNTAHDATPLQQELLRLARTLVGIMLGASVFVFLLGATRGISLVDMLSTSAALAVASVPEGLLVSVTVILTVGMRRMLKRQALVHRLVAAETLGSVNVLCVDKTGTLTTGEMTVTELRVGTELVSVAHADEKTSHLLRDLMTINAANKDVRADGADQVTGSPTESGILRFILEHRDQLASDEFEIVNELPFDSRKKYSAKLIRKAGQERILVMGAPDVLLTKCDLNDAQLRDYHDTLRDMTVRGLRVVLLAEKLSVTSEFSDKVIADLTPLGLVGLTDPLRPHVTQTVREAQAAGVRVVMITGDHPSTAAAIATQLGLPTEAENIVVGNELQAMDAQVLLSRLRTVTVFARVLPEHKLRIVKSLQNLGYAVAMTGDGVNDAPALRVADIGVAVGSGTEVAKETADMVILDNDIRSIIAAVHEGRIIFDNIRKVLGYLLTTSLSEVVLIASVLALGMPVPFAPLHILWINLVTDGFPSVALAFEAGEPNVMREPPRRRGEPLITHGLRSVMIFSGSLAVVGLLLLYVPLHQAGYDMDVIRTMLWLLLGLDSLLIIYPMRTLRQPFWKLRSFQNPTLSLAVCVGLLMLVAPMVIKPLQTLFSLTAIRPGDVALVAGMVVVKILLIELAKAWFLFDVRKPLGVVS